MKRTPLETFLFVLIFGLSVLWFVTILFERKNSKLEQVISQYRIDLDEPDLNPIHSGFVALVENGRVVSTFSAKDIRTQNDVTTFRTQRGRAAWTGQFLVSEKPFVLDDGRVVVD